MTLNFPWQTMRPLRDTGSTIFKAHAPLKTLVGHARRRTVITRVCVTCICKRIYTCTCVRVYTDSALSQCKLVDFSILRVQTRLCLQVSLTVYIRLHCMMCICAWVGENVRTYIREKSGERVTSAKISRVLNSSPVGLTVASHLESGTRLLSATLRY